MNSDSCWAKLRNRSLQEQIAAITPAYLENVHRDRKRGDWFASETQPLLGVDVDKIPFAKEGGYQIYRGDHPPPVLILRLGNLNSVVREAIQEFLEISDFKLVPENIGLQKRYSALYKKFLDEIVHPQAYLDEIYRSGYVNHFYTPQEAQAFRTKWTQ